MNNGKLTPSICAGLKATSLESGSSCFLSFETEKLFVLVIQRPCCDTSVAKQEPLGVLPTDIPTQNQTDKAYPRQRGNLGLDPA